MVQCNTDAVSSISTSRSTNTPSKFYVICSSRAVFVNYLITYLLTYLPYRESSQTHYGGMRSYHGSLDACTVDWYFTIAGCLGGLWVQGCYSASRSGPRPNKSCRCFIVAALDRKLDYHVISNPCRLYITDANVLSVKSHADGQRMLADVRSATNYFFCVQGCQYLEFLAWHGLL